MIWEKNLGSMWPISIDLIGDYFLARLVKKVEERAVGLSGH